MMDNIFGITDIGKVSQNNEDEFIAQKVLKGELLIAGVIDGVGGYYGGEIAAAVTKECLISELSDLSGEITPKLRATFRKANRQIFEEKKQDAALQNMACVLTIAIVDIAGNQLYYAHVGDTRLYLLRDGNLVKLSKDHSFVGFLEDSGRLTEQEAMSHPKRNEINKALGFSESIDKDDEFIETGQSPFLPGDLLLICSDGLTDMVTRDEIAQILTAPSPLKQKGTLLIEAANANGGKDNITAVLVKNNKEPLQHTATKPAATLNETRKTKEHKGEPAEKHTQVKTRSYGVLITVLTLLCLVFFASTLWLYYNNQVQLVKTAPLIVKHQRNAQEIKLQDTINKLKGNTLILSASDFKTPIIISDTLHIEKDTLLIKAKGTIVFASDTGYKGIGILLSGKCKRIVLDSLSFQGFGTAIAAQNNALSLKNVRFVNCKQSIMQSFGFKDEKYVNGRLPESEFSVDSLPKHPKK